MSGAANVVPAAPAIELELAALVVEVLNLDTAAGPLDDQLTIRLQHQRIIVLGREVDDPIANRICAQLLLLSAEDPHRDISLYINSPGGSVTAGMAVYDTMQLIPNDVSTLAMGLAASMGQFLLTAGTPGKRFVLPNAEVLLHQGSAGFGVGGADDVAGTDLLGPLQGVGREAAAPHERPGGAGPLDRGLDGGVDALHHAVVAVQVGR